MIETFAALLLAHVLADFVFQTRWIVLNKRRVPVLLLHGAVVLALMQAALGRVDAWELLALALLHMAIDGVKARLATPGLGAFLADQGAHLAVLAALAALRPDPWTGGALGHPLLPPFAGLAPGLISPGTAVPARLKIGDVDPRGDGATCFTISEKALAIGGGVLEALLTWLNEQAAQEKQGYEK